MPEPIAGLRKSKLFVFHAWFSLLPNTANSNSTAMSIWRRGLADLGGPGRRHGFPGIEQHASGRFRRRGRELRRIRLGSIGGPASARQGRGLLFFAGGSLRAASHTAETYLDMRDFLQVDARRGKCFTLWKPGAFGLLDVQLGYRSRGQNGDEIRAD